MSPFSTVWKTASGAGSSASILSSTAATPGLRWAALLALVAAGAAIYGAAALAVGAASLADLKAAFRRKP